jgi:hypothetical protein
MSTPLQLLFYTSSLDCSTSWLFTGQLTATGQANFLTTLDGNVEGDAVISIEGVADTLTSDAEGKATIKLPSGTYNYSASDALGNTFAGSFTIIKDAEIGVAVAFR